MKLKNFIEMYEPSESDFCARRLDNEEINGIREMTEAKVSPSKPIRRMKPKMALIAAILTVATITNALAMAANLGLFERALGSNAKQYANNINEVNADAAIASRLDNTVRIHSTIFTDNDVYAIIAVKGKAITTEDFAIKGRIAYADHDKTAFGLTSNVKAITPEDGDAGTQYFLYSATIAPTKISDNKELVLAAGDNFLKLSSLRDYESGKLKSNLELTVTLGGKDSVLTTAVSRVSTEALSFHPSATQYKGDYYKTVLLTPYELKMSGQSKKSTEELQQAEKLSSNNPLRLWYMPDVTVTIVLSDGKELTLASYSGERITFKKNGLGTDLPYAEKLLCGASAGGEAETGEYYNWFNFREWKLDLTTVAYILIDGIKYEISR